MQFDTFNQLYQYTTSSPTYYNTLGVYYDGEFIDHHPVFITIIFGLFLDFGKLVGSQNIGIFSYIILQALFASGSLALSCCYLEKLAVPKVMRIAALLFIAIFPAFAQFSATMVKDSLFAPLFVLYFICFTEVFLTKGTACKNIKFMVLFMLVISLCILTKKTGLYIVGPSGIVLLFAYKKQWVPLLISFALPIIVCSALIPTFLFPVLKVAPGGEQESLSTFFQQTAAFCLKYPDEITSEESEIIKSVIDFDSFGSLYEETSVDPVKNSFNPEASTDDLVKYLIVWANQGLKDPIVYLDAITKVNIGLLSPTEMITYYGKAGTDHERELLANLLALKPGDAEITDNKNRKTFRFRRAGCPYSKLLL